MKLATQKGTAAAWLALVMMLPSAALGQEVRHYRGTCTNVSVQVVAPVAIDMRVDARSIGGELRISPPLMGSGSFSGTKVNGICRGLSTTGIQFSGLCTGTFFNPVYVVSGQTGFCTTRLAGQIARSPVQKPPAPVLAKRPAAAANSPNPAPAPAPAAPPVAPAQPPGMGLIEQ
jgi:hypothetical protein